MPPNEKNGWNEWSKFVLKELERLNTCYERLDEKLDKTGRWQRKTWVTMMKKYYAEKLGQLL